MDTFLVKEGKVIQVWRNHSIEQVAAERDWTGLGDLHEVEPEKVVCGMLYENGALTPPPPQPRD